MRVPKHPFAKNAPLALAAVGLGGCLALEDLPPLAEECERRCVAIHANASSCSSGRCVLDCEAGYGDCNGDGHDGCEERLDTESHCGACGTVCGTAHARSAGCSNGQCAMTCVDWFLDCDGDPSNGCEIDGEADTENCRTCGHTCEGGCAAANCVPMTLFEGFDDAPTEIVLSKSDAYWPTAHAIIDIPLHGGRSSSACAADAPAFLALSSTDIYWFEASSSSIYRASLPQGAPRHVIGGQNVAGLAVDDEDLFWSDTTSREIRAFDSPSFKTIASSPSLGVGRIALDAQNVYFTTELAHALYRVARGGGPITELFANDLQTIDAITLDAAHVYLATHDTHGGIMVAVGKDGSGLANLVWMAETHNIATDGEYIFFTDTAAGWVEKTSTKGEGGAWVVQKDQARPWALALDATSVYWTNLGDGSTNAAIMKVEKAP